jgi:hypothetical protein
MKKNTWVAKNTFCYKLLQIPVTKLTVLGSYARMPIRYKYKLLNIHFGGDRPTAWCCGFNRSMQYTRICVSRRSVADEAKTTDLLHGKPKSSNVGTLAER